MLRPPCLRIPVRNWSISCLTPSCLQASTHSSASRFIQDFSLAHNASQERVAELQAALEHIRTPHEEIQSKRRTHLLTDACRLGRCGAFVRHNDEHIHVRTLRRPAARMRAKEHNLLWMKALRNFI